MQSIRNEKNKSESARILSKAHTAKRRFFDCISSGIEVLVQRHGYCPVRATNIILDQIRQNDSSPTDDETFQVMQRNGMGLEDATKAIIVAKALKRVQVEKSLNPVDAIEHLSSCLTTMKLLGTVEKRTYSSAESLGLSTSASTSSLPSASTSISGEFVNQIAKNSSDAVTSTSSSSVSSISRTTSTRNTSTTSEPNLNHDPQTPHSTSDADIPRPKTTTNSRRTTTKKLRKTQRKITTPTCTTTTNETNHTSNDVDVKVAEQKAKALHSQGNHAHADAPHTRSNKAPSPSANRGKRGVTHAHLDTLGLPQVVEEQQQPVKRQRLDSI